MQITIEVQDKHEARAIQMIVKERRRQDEKFGKQDHDPAWWMVIMGEEFGETCEAVCEYRWAEANPEHKSRQDRIRHAVEEASQVAAVGAAMIQAILRDEYRDEITSVLPSDRMQVAKALGWGGENVRYPDAEPMPCGFPTCTLHDGNHKDSEAAGKTMHAFKPPTQTIAPAPTATASQMGKF